MSLFMSLNIEEQIAFGNKMSYLFKEKGIPVFEHKIDADGNIKS